MVYTYTIKDIMKITGVTKRTLHYYDEIGLLSPKKNNKNYRIYEQQDLEKLQKILVFKSLDLDISKIKQYISYENDKLRKILSEELTNLDKKISDLQAIQQSINNFVNGDSLLNSGILNNPLQSQYDTEASIKYGNTKVYQSFIKRQDSLQIGDIQHEMTSLFNQFNQMSLNNHPIQACRDIVLKWKALMISIADFDDRTLCCIAKTYENDTRFNDYFSTYHNENLTSYISKAVHYFLCK